MPFSAGDHVHVANLGKGIVRQVRNGERYLVEVKGRSVVVEGAQLGAVETGKRRLRPASAPVSPGRIDADASARAVAALDLHGMTPLEAVAALDAFLNDAILAGLAGVRVIHGRSGGRLRTAVHQRLRAVTSVRSFRVDPANPGVTIVTF